MAKHALISTVRDGNSVSTFTQEFATRELAEIGKAAYHRSVEFSNLRVYSIIVQVEQERIAESLGPR